MPNNGVLFFPSTSVTVGGGGSGTFAMNVLTGPLLTGVPATVTHSMGYTNYAFQINDATNIAHVDSIYVDPAVGVPEP